VLTWQYAENAWATVRGTTTTTGDINRMLELARALRPTERAPIRAPLSLTNVAAASHRTRVSPTRSVLR
jgi:hypothetical protein